MQSLGWYARRLRAMSPAELAWRLRSEATDLLDHARAALGCFPPALPEPGPPSPPVFRLTPLAVGCWASAPAGSPQAGWKRRLLAAADEVRGHRFTFMGLERRHLGDPIDWNRDHEADVAAPMGFAPRIDYRDYTVTGDAKLVWEPSRHQQLVVLARAYRATGDVTYVGAAIEQLESWRAQCPFGRGMQWRSPLELAIRIINWTWAADLVWEALDDVSRVSLLEGVQLHLWEVTRKYSRGSSANNHRIGEAAGVFVASSYFGGLPGAREWREESRGILEEEILRQTHADGGTREQAFGYHLFVVQFFLACGLVGRWQGRPFSSRYWKRLEAMLEFVAGMCEGGAPPSFGDADDGYVLDLGSRDDEAGGLLAAGAVLFERADLARAARRFHEPALWLCGSDAPARFDALLAASARSPLSSRSFRDTGCYLLQAGDREDETDISVLFDCAELGFGPLAAHGHADALSVTVRAFAGREVLVDPGTYDYFTYAAWRRYFRSTRAHNTIEVDGEDQSEMRGPFMWGERARVACLEWSPAPEGGRVAGEHDGYRRLADPVIHRRTVTLEGAGRRLTVRDEIVAAGEHELALWFHLGPDCTAHIGDGGRVEVTLGEHRLTLDFDPRLRVSTLFGSESPIGGWFSPGYHRRRPTTTLRAAGRSAGSCVYETVLDISLPVPRPRASPAEWDVNSAAPV